MKIDQGDVGPKYLKHTNGLGTPGPKLLKLLEKNVAKNEGRRRDPPSHQRPLILLGLRRWITTTTITNITSNTTKRHLLDRRRLQKSRRRRKYAPSRPPQHRTRSCSHNRRAPSPIYRAGGSEARTNAPHPPRTHPFSRHRLRAILPHTRFPNSGVAATNRIEGREGSEIAPWKPCYLLRLPFTTHLRRRAAPLTTSPTMLSVCPSRAGSSVSLASCESEVRERQEFKHTDTPFSPTSSMEDLEAVTRAQRRRRSSDDNIGEAKRCYCGARSLQSIPDQDKGEMFPVYVPLLVMSAVSAASVVYLYCKNRGNSRQGYMDVQEKPSDGD